MLLDTIESPADLKRLSEEELETLAGEIREFIVKSVSVTGGHLGSNLGVVELTLALHRVFDSPRDVLLWDTGHQAYAHKIVTGRQEHFATLRQGGGLSGYPSRNESEHDWVENSHASTILSYAHGLATALRLRHETHRRVVAVIGDGAMTGGMAFEALNNLGHSQAPVLIVLNDNGRSYAPTVSRLAAGLTRLRLSPAYVKNRDRLQRVLRGVPRIGEQLEMGMEGVRAAFREVLEPNGFFEALGVRYIGPVDGHDIVNLERVLAQAAEYEGPIIVHVLTQKGRGYGPAEADDEKCLHDAPVFDPATGPPPWVPVGYTQAFAEAIVDAADDDDRIVAITAAMPGPTGLLPFQARHPERFLDVGIAEQHAVTAAAGMAMGGLRPVVAVYSTFLTRAFDQINLDVGLHRLPVVFCIDRAGITGDDGPSHHGVLDLALLTKVPGMTVFAPSSAQEMEVMLGAALGKTDGPSALRYAKGPARQVRADQVGSGMSGRLVRQGTDVCILAVGKLVEAAEEAAAVLAHD
ncbi:MAG TPA: 1-deoxy-D-xylulose-5-phosphate synthase, partial [Acidimicrobiales bacterium]|nr:1-deoxy-D-xylulose-5-phosphate synthase [Acidimicrobiales bacterium]